MSSLVLARPQIISTVKTLAIKSGNVIAKQSPIILAGSAIMGVGTTFVLATKAGVKANALIEQAKYEKGGEELTFKEKAEASWKAYIPPVISAGLTIGAIVASTAISQKRQAALAGLYALSEAALKDYQAKTEEIVGKNTAQKIRDGVNADSIGSKQVPPEFANDVSGKVLCFDKMSGRYFMSSVELLQRAANEVNRAILSGDMCASLNELYSQMGLDEIGFGEEVGWNIDSLCELYFTSTLTSGMRPCLVLDYTHGHEPNYRYRDI